MEVIECILRMHFLEGLRVIDKLPRKHYERCSFKLRCSIFTGPKVSENSLCWRVCDDLKSVGWAHQRPHSNY